MKIQSSFISYTDLKKQPVKHEIHTVAVSLLATTANITNNYCIYITLRVGLGLW